MEQSRRPWAAVVAAMIAFASNSILCRLALRDGALDPVSFTLLRVASGAVVLAAIVAIRERRLAAADGNWTSALALFGYAIAFSIAYVRSTAGIGALILFASVQLTMVGVAIWRGERPTALQWLGLAMAVAGVVILSWRGVRAPDPFSSALMATAGVSWGIYSLRGRSSRRPLADTAGNFIRATPLAVVFALAALSTARISTPGLLLAIASGALASGLGYSIWYLALPHLTATRAAVVQLPVPLLTAIGGILVLGETPTLRLAIASVLILGGVAIAILGRADRSRLRTSDDAVVSSRK